MTRYTVVWARDAVNDVADLWLVAGDRDEIALASHRIQQDLAADATAKGVEVSEGLRALNVPPLRILFSVREDDRVVEVLCVKRI